MLSIGDDRRLMPASRRLGHKTYPHSRAECKNPKLRSATAALDYPQAFYMAANPGYDAVVDDPRWPDETDRTTPDPYYDRVARELRVAPLPESIDLPKRNEYRAVAARLGRTVFDPDQAVSWTAPEGNGRESCQLVAEC